MKHNFATVKQQNCNYINVNPYIVYQYIIIYFRTWGYRTILIILFMNGGCDAKVHNKGVIDVSYQTHLKYFFEQRAYSQELYICTSHVSQQHETLLYPL